ncbi:hypothetical protein [Peribacillus simplex]|uniref:hypothetical protein n=1 Tax=Peribacillus simplex TaxID=1478 RepID=UPI003D06B7A1
MKKNFILAAGVISIGLLGACMQEEKYVEIKTSAEVEPTEVEELSSEEVTEEPEFEEEEMSELEASGSFEGQIGYYADAFGGGVERDNADVIKEDGHPAEYYYYGEATAFINEFENSLDVRDGMKEDFNNLMALSFIIEVEQEKVLDGVTLPKGTDKWEAHKYWNEPTDRQKQAIKYMSLVFNDLDIAVNELPKEPTGYTYFSEGKKVEEIEKFISSSN